MNTLDYIIKKYNLNTNQRMPIQINHSRWKEMPSLFSELGFKVGAEIGVLKGQFTKALCEKGLKVYGIDLWEEYDTYNDYKGEENFNRYYQEAVERTKDYDCTLIKGWSSDIVKDFEDNSLDFVFIDGNHALEYVIEDIAKWSPKVREGGIISGHDYFRGHGKNLMHAKDAVNTWTYCYKINPWFIFAKDKCPSWFWVK